ncbi:hypothetical protein ACFT8W_40245 [Streptomyces hygroscopicus]|uniref:hypothetical protein n=1 Tax=Streptomyces hygroscopicus TaxID=1912 RepID=UPI00362C5A5E
MSGSRAVVSDRAGVVYGSRGVVSGRAGAVSDSRDAVSGRAAAVSGANVMTSAPWSRSAAVTAATVVSSAPPPEVTTSQLPVSRGATGSGRSFQAMR